MFWPVRQSPAVCIGHTTYQTSVRAQPAEVPQILRHNPRYARCVFLYGDELVIRALRSVELEAIEDMAASLAFVITPVVILPPSAEAIGF